MAAQTHRVMCVCVSTSGHTDQQQHTFCLKGKEAKPHRYPPLFLLYVKKRNLSGNAKKIKNKKKNLHPGMRRLCFLEQVSKADSFNYQVLSLCLGFQFLPAKLLMIFKMPAGKLLFCLSSLRPPHPPLSLPTKTWIAQFRGLFVLQSLCKNLYSAADIFFKGKKKWRA